MFRDRTFTVRTLLGQRRVAVEEVLRVTNTDFKGVVVFVSISLFTVFSLSFDLYLLLCCLTVLLSSDVTLCVRLLMCHSVPWADACTCALY